MKATDWKLIQEYAEKLGGALTLADMKVLFHAQSVPALFKKLNAAIREGLLVKVKRGLYVLPSTSLETVSYRIDPEAYISTGTVLARELLIGSIPVRRVQAVKVGRPRTYRFAMGTVEHLSVKSGLFFGFVQRNGIRYATPEKAFLDACYFRFKGRRFSFDLDGDVNHEGLNREKVGEYLKAYDRRFAAFFRQKWGGR